LLLQAILAERSRVLAFTEGWNVICTVTSQCMQRASLRTLGRSACYSS